jgi:YrbI family 3-deoxy-D-manno-octulosonate 8-phosphate phosphatase
MRIKLDLFHTVVFDFDGVFTDNFVFVNQDGIESVRVSRADGYAIDLLKKFARVYNVQLSILILSTETNSVVSARAKKLNLRCISGKSDKLKALESLFESERPSDNDPFSGLIYFGNDLNDFPVFRRAGVSFAPCDAHQKIKEMADFVLNSPGGHGFVREGVEFLLGIEAMSTEELSEFISNR